MVRTKCTRNFRHRTNKNSIWLTNIWVRIKNIVWPSWMKTSNLNLKLNLNVVTNVFKWKYFITKVVCLHGWQTDNGKAGTIMKIECLNKFQEKKMIVNK
jgi:hypothetical protein